MTFTILREIPTLYTHVYCLQLESVSVALDSTNRDLTNALSSKDELVRRYAGLEEKVKDYEVAMEKLTNELEAEKDQTRRLWEKDNEVLNRFVC